MSDQVLVFVADEKYIPHYKSLAVNCKRQGKYTGDILCVVPDTMDPWAVDLAERGWTLLPTSDRGFLAKFDIFHPALKQWKQAAYLDSDIIVQRPIHILFDYLNDTPVEPDGTRKILASHEESPAWMAWRVWDKEFDAHAAIYETMKPRFPHIFSTERMFSTCLLVFEPACIPDGTVERLREVQAEFFLCNDPSKGGTDQQITDMLLHNSMRQVQEKAWTFFGLDEMNARVKSESRGWRGDEVPVAIHFTRWYHPSIVKTPDMEAYRNIDLNRPCHEIYQENLAAFETEFPKL
jgi:hypothetical protein